MLIRRVDLDEATIADVASEMGITPGSLVEVRRAAPLGDPIHINVRGYELSLRRSEASAVQVELC